MFCDLALCDFEETFESKERPEPCPAEWAEGPRQDLGNGSSRHIAIANVFPGTPTGKMAVRLGQNGHQLYLSGPDGMAVRAVAEAVRRQGGCAEVLAADVGTSAGTSNFVGFVERHCGRLDGLIWGAMSPVGRFVEGSLVETETSVVTRLLRDHVSATIEVARQTVESLMDEVRPGQILVFGVGDGWRGVTRGNSCGHNLTNQFLDATVAHLVCKFGDRAHFNFIAPGWIREDREYRREPCACPILTWTPDELVMKAVELVLGGPEQLVQR